MLTGDVLQKISGYGLVELSLVAGAFPFLYFLTDKFASKHGGLFGNLTTVEEEDRLLLVTALLRVAEAGCC